MTIPAIAPPEIVLGQLVPDWRGVRDESMGACDESYFVRTSWMIINWGLERGAVVRFCESARFVEFGRGGLSHGIGACLPLKAV